MPEPATIDLNSDLGEGFGAYTMGDDDALLDLVTSANIACGFHGGDPAIMRRTCERAVAAGVRIGAHIGYRDLAGFGRRAIDADPATVRDEAVYQIAALDGFARSAGDRVRYVKPHGALYHAAAGDERIAAAVIGAIVDLGTALDLLGPPNSVLQQAADAAGVRYAVEGFADRSYTPTGDLTPRRELNAVLDHDSALAQALSIATSGAVVATDGSTVDIFARSLCVHGDSPGAVAMARTIRAAILDKGIALGAFT
ncbi:MAG TPA: 5-oxoprolinase subunit PxpA [Aldersonia sp.]